MSLSAARVINYRRHLRALSICMFLVFSPVALMAVLWKLFPVGTWLLAVSAFCVEVVVKGKFIESLLNVALHKNLGRSPELVRCITFPISNSFSYGDGVCSISI